MLISIAISFAVALAVVGAALGLFKFTVIHAALYATPILILSVRHTSASWSVALRLSLLVLAFASGYFLVRHLAAPRAAPPAQVSAAEAQSRRYGPTLVAITALSCIYHFSKVGIPALSSNVELSRLAVGGSGLFGVPSRLYLYGTFLTCAVAVSEAMRRGVRPPNDRIVQFSFALLVATRLLAGFKSGLWQCMLFGIVLASLSLGGVSVRMHRLGVLAVGLIAVAFAYFTGSSYASYQASNSVTDQLATRLTSGSAEPVALALQVGPSDLGDPRSPIQMDVDYFLPRYFGVGPPTAYGFTRLLAGRISGVSPYSINQIAPVTIGLNAYLYYSYKRIALILIFLVGCLLAFLEMEANRARFRSIRFAVFAGLTQMLLDTLARGELVYTVINWLFSIALILVIVGVRAFHNPRGMHFTGREVIDMPDEWKALAPSALDDSAHLPGASGSSTLDQTRHETEV